jgi:TrmH family RNA methyltransferase
MTWIVDFETRQVAAQHSPNSSSNHCRIGSLADLEIVESAAGSGTGGRPPIGARPPGCIRQHDHPVVVEHDESILRAADWLVDIGPGAGEHGGEVVVVTHPILEKISRRDNPQTVLGVFEQAFTPLSAIRHDSAPCWVALEQVRDPGNLGTIIRTADAAGCGGVILIGDCVDPFSVEAVRATMGSVFAVAIARTSPTDFLAWREGWPGSVVGTRLDATVGYRDAAYARPTLILMGNEQAGLTDTLASACDVNVKIPMRGRADSLNLAVATGVMIYAVTDVLAPV